MPVTLLQFEKSLSELETRLDTLCNPEEGHIPAVVLDEIQQLEQERDEKLRALYADLTPWQKTQVSRHPERPRFGDLAHRLLDDYLTLDGDRKYANDLAVIGGIGRFRGRSIILIGHEKGKDTEGRIRHNFGMGKPEGYRKAARLMDMADRFQLPVVTLIDTPGAFPGIEAEERGQAEAVARATEACLALRVPMISVIVGEGGSGGAISIASGNQVFMLEHAIYSVISPEGCASILWRTASKAADAAAAMRLTAQDLSDLGIIEGIIPEPLGGAHRDPKLMIDRIGDTLETALEGYDGMSAEDIHKQRNDKYLKIGMN